MKLVLKMNELGLYKTEDGRYGIQRVAEERYDVRLKEDLYDPWSWKLLASLKTFDDACMFVTQMMRPLKSNATE
jgi:hypothetical protein